MALTFNETFYLSNNADVLAAVGRGTLANALQHYNLFGQRELRNPNSTFNAREYLLQNPDLVTAFQNGTLLNVFDHYTRFGVVENRAPNSALLGFNATTYLANNPDVAAAVGAGKAFSSAMQHYLLFGSAEGRAAPGTPTGGLTGSSFSLTTGVDNISGTTGNDTVNGSTDYNNTAAPGSASTFSAADIINGGAGTADVFNLTLSNANAGFGLAVGQVSNIEIFNFRNVAGQVFTLNAGLTPGATQVWSDRGTNASIFNSLANGTTVGVRADGSSASPNVSYAYATGTTAVALTLEGGTKTGTLRADDNSAADQAPTTVVLNSNGTAANAVGTLSFTDTKDAVDGFTATATVTSLTINAAANLTASLTAGDFGANAKVTLNGAGKIDLSGAALAANVTTVDGSASTGGISVIGGTNNVSITGGSGNDTIALNALVNTSATVSGGAGTDIIQLTDQAALTAAIGARFTNFEILRLADDDDGAVDTFNLSHIAGITGLQLNADSAGDGYAVTNISAAQAGQITIRGTQAVAPNLSVTNATNVGQIDAMTITVDDGASAKADITLADLTAAGVETVNIVGTENVTFTAMTGLTALTGMTLTGVGNFSLTTGALPINVNTTIDGSALTGTLTFVGTAGTTNGLKVTGGSGNDTITGTNQADALLGNAGNDTFTSNNGIDTLTGGAGRDTFNVTATAIANRDVITDFTGGSGNDVLQFATTYLKANNTAATAGQLTSDNVRTIATSGNLTGAASQFVFLITVENVSGSLSTDGASVLNALVTGAGSGTITVANKVDTLVFLVTNGTDTGVYYGDAANADTDLGAAEIVLVGTLSGVNNLTTLFAAPTTGAVANTSNFVVV